MDELLRYVGQVIGTTFDHSKWLRNNGAWTPNPFSLIHHRLRICILTLEIFYKHWKKPKQTNLVQGQFHIIQSVTSDVFISSMSAVEYTSKIYVESRGNKDFIKLKNAIKGGENVPLIHIMGRSKNRKVGIISQNDYDDWNFLRSMRNIQVHNNAIPRCNKTYDLNGRVYNLRKGVMVRGIDMSDHIFFVENIDRLYFNWIQGFFKRVCM